HRAMTGELFKQLFESRVATETPFALAHTVNHVGEQPCSAFGSENRRGPLQQKRSWAERLDLEAHRAQVRNRCLDLRGPRRIQFYGGRSEHCLDLDSAVTELRSELLKGHPLVRGVLVDQQHSFLAFERDITSEQLSDDAQPRVGRNGSCGYGRGSVV